ncbi:hypothetical protein D3C84_304780 [compost metagenome]
MQGAQPQAAGGAAVEKADEVVQGQQQQAAEQGAKDIGGLFLGHQPGLVDELEPGHQRMVRGHAYIGLAGLAVVGQGQQVGAGIERSRAHRSGFAGLQLAFERAVAQQVVVEVLHARSEDPQPARLLVARQLDMQPDGLFAGGGGEGLSAQRLELLLACPHILQGQRGTRVEQIRPVFGLAVSGVWHVLGHGCRQQTGHEQSDE